MGHPETDSVLTQPEQQDAAYQASFISPRWWPELDAAAWRLLGVCDSLLEKLFFLGLVFQMDKRRLWSGFDQQRVYGIGERWHFDSPLLGFVGGQGPTQMTVRPQLPRRGLIYDFGISFGRGLSLAIEVDGYAHHRSWKARSWDHIKACKLAAPVLRLQEEIEKPETWAERILDRTGEPCNHCGEHIRGEHFPCPPF